MHYEGALIVLAVVSGTAWLAQLIGAWYVEAKVWRKLTEKRELKKVLHQPAWSAWTWRHPLKSTFPWRWSLLFICTEHSDPQADRLAAGRLNKARSLLEVHEVLTWKNDSSHWENRAAVIRSSFLQRTQETAERWRNIFAGLLGVFGAVFFVNKPNLTATSEPERLGWTILVVVALALNAVAFTGWSAAGLPKMLVDVEGPSAFQVEMRQGARALARLRVGIAAGALTAVGLILVVAGALSQPVR